ncbi:MAG: LptF/LptG family permease [Bacteroidota bacterium]
MCFCLFFMKKLHLLLIKSFLPPFIITLFVSTFLFFLVEVVITYLDDFVGKGLSTWVLTQLFTYAFLAIVPKCIPLAVLLASIMTMGNLAENYELAAMKSSGISLFRIFYPLIVLMSVIALLTFAFNNFALPKIMLESQSLLFDIRQTKPSVSIKEKVFYNQIENFSIRVDKKYPDGHSLKGILIYDHSGSVGNNVQLYADSGYMFTSSDTNYLVIQLFNGSRYENVQTENAYRTFPLSIMHFKEMEINIDLSGFKLKRTDKNLFKQHHEMMNMWEIAEETDSLVHLAETKHQSIYNQLSTYFFVNVLKEDSQKNCVETINIIQKLSTSEKNLLKEMQLNHLRSLNAFLEAESMQLQGLKRRIAEYQVAWHERLVLSIACLILFFVGAPLGSIIRKGGFGLPVVVATLFFILYMILTDSMRSMAMELIMPPFIAMWLPLFIFLIIGIFLTYKAANDSTLFDLDWYIQTIKRYIKPKWNSNNEK